MAALQVMVCGRWQSDQLMVPDDANSSLSDDVKQNPSVFLIATLLSKELEQAYIVQAAELELQLELLGYSLSPFLLWMPLCLNVMKCRIQNQHRVEMKFEKRSRQFIWQQVDVFWNDDKTKPV